MHDVGAIFAHIQYEVVRKSSHTPDSARILGRSLLELMGSLGSCLGGNNAVFDMLTIRDCHLNLESSQSLSDLMRESYETAGIREDLWR